MFLSPPVISRIAQDPQVSAGPVVTGSLEVPEHPVHPVSPPQDPEVLVSSVHPGEVPAGEVAVPISSGASIGIGGPTGEVPARDVPVPRVMSGVLVFSSW